MNPFWLFISVLVYILTSDLVFALNVFLNRCQIWHWSPPQEGFYWVRQRHRCSSRNTEKDWQNSYLHRPKMKNYSKVRENQSNTVEYSHKSLNPIDPVHKSQTAPQITYNVTVLFYSKCKTALLDTSGILYD